jgi:hypothetical protein
MAKRNRGANRPGHRRGHPRHQNRPAPRPSQGLSAAEEARAAEFESEIVAQQRAAESDRARDANRLAERAAEAPRPRAGAPLAVRAAAEYAYVSRDVRRILRVGGSMIVIMAVLFVLIRVLNLVSV